MITLAFIVLVAFTTLSMNVYAMGLAAFVDLIAFNTITNIYAPKFDDSFVEGE